MLSRKVLSLTKPKGKIYKTKSLGHYITKTPVIENEYNNLEKSQPQIEKPDYIENKTKINKMKQNVIREVAKVTNTYMKDKVSLKKQKIKIKWKITKKT